ncbi:MAG: TfoX/Sxy family protein [Thaumarchaeota archaeon]|nr:TfoX/Sxy family protein [Nitrososphaerota archaeon]
MKMPRPDDEDRAFFRSVLPKDPRIKVRPMFGNDAAFLDGNVFTGLFGTQLFVRLSGEDQEELLREKGASRFSPMKGRPMSGYIVVPDAWRGDPERVSTWVARSLVWASGLPSKVPKRSRK